ncbi:MAG TPA: UDP-N-acetylglucosamine 2-epimerase (non-hydrolyzing) [Bryobacteraceae bacterium]|nr:UDP-N-acetylglucosamine 2-epimerase (non-hydrolyzing) [Bryobacteraceae bacterium]
MKVLFVFGTRPEAIKLAPVVRCLMDDPRFDARIAVTAQHRAMLDQVLEAFSLRPDHDLNVMQPGQTLAQSASRILAALEPVLDAEKPDCVIVQGDTTTTFCGALAAFYKAIPVAHVEAGLRTGDVRQPFPEEMNRLLTTRLTSLHFAATEGAAENLRREGIDPKTIFVTGNTGIDAVLAVRATLPPAEPGSKRMILVTAHRRESFGEGFVNICRALKRLAARGDVEIVYPVHPNPNVRAAVDEYLRNVSNITLIEPQEYVPFVSLMNRAHILLTDSGGIQEEGPSLGKPVLVMRQKTERPEAVEAGTARLLGTNEEKIVAEASLLLDDPNEYARRARIHNPYGDGQASARIRDALIGFFSNY